MSFSLRFLGTGWSHGVPMIGCSCPVCTGAHPRNRRRRPGLLVQGPNSSVVIDTGPDFREQALTFRIQELDAVFITHQHADHVMGLDDVRRFTWNRPNPMPVFAEPATLSRLRVLYPYVTEVRVPGLAVPKVCFQPWTRTEELDGIRFTPLPVPHDHLPCCGVLIEGAGKRAAYIPDCSDLPAALQKTLKGIDLLILNALRLTPHPAHLTLEQSLRHIARLAPRQALLTHMGCPLDYESINPTLPPGVEMAYDGLLVDMHHA